MAECLNSPVVAVPFCILFGGYYWPMLGIYGDHGKENRNYRDYGIILYGFARNFLALSHFRRR